MITTDPFTNEQEAPAIFNPLTAGGNPAPIDGDVVWEKLDGDGELGAVEDNGKKQWLRSQASPGVGVSHFRATADADMGQGFTPITLDYEITVIAPGATAASGSFGAARLKTPTP